MGLAISAVVWVAVGMRLLTKDGNIVDIDQIDHREGEFTVYNFAVEGISTYFVSGLGLLVHNACGDPDGLSRKQNGQYTEPTLPEKVLARDGEVTIVHNYRSNDHAPAHVHVVGGGKETRIKMNGKPMPGDPLPTPKQTKVLNDNRSQINKALKKISRWLDFQDLPD
jgi:hypothetical protein